MASEPPANAGPNEAEESAPLPTSAEDRKAAAALSKLDENDDSSAPAKEVDADALGKAMKNLNVKEGAGEETKKKVKVDAVDIALLVSRIWWGEVARMETNWWV